MAHACYHDISASFLAQGKRWSNTELKPLKLEPKSFFSFKLFLSVICDVDTQLTHRKESGRGRASCQSNSHS